MTPVELLVLFVLGAGAALALGLATAALAMIVRALSPQHWLLHKPLSCDLCMSVWPSLIGAVGLAVSLAPCNIGLDWIVAPVAFGASIVVSYLTLRTVHRLTD